MHRPGRSLPCRCARAEGRSGRRVAARRCTAQQARHAGLSQSVRLQQLVMRPALVTSSLPLPLLCVGGPAAQVFGGLVTGMVVKYCDNSKLILSHLPHTRVLWPRRCVDARLNEWAVEVEASRCRCCPRRRRALAAGLQGCGSQLPRCRSARVQPGRLAPLHSLRPRHAPQSRKTRPCRTPRCALQS